MLPSAPTSKPTGEIEQLSFTHHDDIGGEPHISSPPPLSKRRPPAAAHHTLVDCFPPVADKLSRAALDLFAPWRR